MAGRIEDYAIVERYASATLISRDGSADWLCGRVLTPRPVSPRCSAMSGMVTG